jgi:hypothetical protein
MYKAGKNPFQWLQKVLVVPFVQGELVGEHETKLSRTIDESTQVRRLKLPFV